MRPWLTIALGVIAVAEDDAIAAYVRFARTTLPKLEKAWAAPHRADPVNFGVKQGKRGRVLLLTFPNSGTSYTIRAAECLADSQMCSSYLHECEKSRVVKESTSHPFLDRNPELVSFQGGKLNIRDPAKLEKAMALYFNGRPAEQLVEFQARLANLRSPSRAARWTRRALKHARSFATKASRCPSTCTCSTRLR